MVLNILRWKVVSWVMFSNPLWIVIASQVTMVRFDLSYYVEVIFIICGTLYYEWNIQPQKKLFASQKNCFRSWLKVEVIAVCQCSTTKCECFVLLNLNFPAINYLSWNRSNYEDILFYKCTLDLRYTLNSFLLDSLLLFFSIFRLKMFI